MAFIVPWSNGGKDDFFPRIVEQRISSSVNISPIKKRSRRVGCRFDWVSAEANDAPLIITPIPFINSTLDIFPYNIKYMHL